MDLRQLRYFMGIVAAGSLNRAAETLHVAQPALSRQLRALEDDLGVRLVHRTPRGVELTEAGRRLHELADFLLRTADNLKAEVVSAAREPAGHLVVGLPPSLAPLFAPILIDGTRRAYPPLRLRIIEALSIFLTEWVEQGRIDLAVLTDPPPEHHLDRRDLGLEDLVLVGRADRLGDPQAPVSPATLDRDDLVIPSGFLRFIEPWFAGHGLRPRLAMELDSVHAVAGLLDHGLCVAVISYAMVHESVVAGALVARRFEDPGVQRRLVLARSAGRPATLSLTALSDLIAESMPALPKTLALL